MKNLSLLLIVLILLQSCESYKAVSISEIKKGKTYEIILKNGQNLETKCNRITDQNISFLINDNIVEMPKSEIVSAKKRKVSTYKLVGGVALATVGVVLLLNSGDKDKLKTAGD